MREIKENWTPSKDKYETLHKRIGHKLNISHLVIQAIRSYFAQHEGTDLERLHQMRKKSEKDLVELNRYARAAKIDFANLVLKNEVGMKQTQARIAALQEQLPAIIGFIKHINYRKSLIHYIKYLEGGENGRLDILHKIIDPELLEDKE